MLWNIGRASVRFARQQETFAKQHDGKIERGTAVIERPWIRFSE
jgi:hypothetical protein